MSEVETTIIGAIFVGGIGFFVSYGLWKIQEDNRKKSIEAAFRTEIEQLDPILQRVFTLVKNRKPPIWDKYGNDENDEYNRKMYDELQFLKIYSDSGYWYDIKKQVPSIDPKISSSLDCFYRNIIEAEDNRRNYIDGCYRDKKDIYLTPLQQNLEEAMKNLSEIKSLLKK